MKAHKNKLSSLESRDLQKAVMRAIKALLKLVQDEPSVIIINGEPNIDISESTINEITEWLFHQRDNNDNTND